MNGNFCKFLQIACVFTAIFISIGTSQPIYANDISTDDFLTKALVSYENLISKGYLDKKDCLSDTIFKLVEERQSFYQKCIVEGLHSDLVRIESTFDLTTIEQKGTLQNTLFYNPTYYSFPCTDCVNYVSQALYYGGIPTMGTWYPYSVVWRWVSNFQSNIISNDLGYYTSASLLGLGDLGIIPNTHVGMVSALNPMRYSCHTNDRLNYPWTTQSTYCVNMY